MKILSAVQIRELDAYTIANEPIASIDLMERAATAFTQWFTERFHAGNRIGVVCGTGNNGGDGLAIARLLKEWGFPVRVWIVGSKPGSEDFEINRKRLPQAIQATEITEPLPANTFDCDVLVDGIFGTGLSRPAEGIYAAVIEAMNASAAIRVAIDLPSGLQADNPSGGAIVEARYTVSFQLPKLAFFQPGNHRYVGEWVLVDIGLSKERIRSMETSDVFLVKRNIKKLMRQVSVFAHKGSNGRALVVAGSEGKMGACVLASRAAIRSGLGLLTVHVPACGYTIVQTAVPEAMASIDVDDRVFTQPPPGLDAYDAIGLGPGIGTADQTVAAVEQILKKYKRPLVIDADGLNILVSHRNLWKEVPPGSILTPHPGEFERLVGSWSDDFEKLDRLRSLSRQLNSYIILKGAYAVTCAPNGRLFFNSTGNPGMAKGGSGDALTGVLSGLLAQGYDPLEACKIGVFVHGLAGDLALRDGSVEGLIPSDLIGRLPAAFREVRH